MRQPTADLRISTARPLLSPAILEEDLPLSEAGAATVQAARRAVGEILAGRDDRLLAVVGPCSIHDPAAALDYEHTDTGEWLANCSTCCVPEISNVFARAEVPFRVVSGMLHDDPIAWREIEGARVGFTPWGVPSRYPGYVRLRLRTRHPIVGRWVTTIAPTRDAALRVTAEIADRVREAL